MKDKSLMCRSCQASETEKLSAKAIQSPALPLQSIDHIHGSDSLPLGMFGVGDSVSDDILQEDLRTRYHIYIHMYFPYLENAPGLFINKPRDSLDATPPGKSTDRRLGDTLKEISQNHPDSIYVKI